MASSGRQAKHERFAREKGAPAAVAELVEPVLSGLGYRLVRVRITGKTEKILQVMAERADGTMTVADCEAISRQLSPLLDVHDPIAGSYRLEISSPGIDRPLVRPSDFETWSGHEAKIELKELVDGRKRFRGTLEGFEDGEIRITVDLKDRGTTTLGLPINLIEEAKLVLTDDLIREALQKSKHQKANPGEVNEGMFAETLPEDLEVEIEEESKE